MEIFLNIFGWYGALAIVLAYFLNSFGLLNTGLTYQLLNLSGAIGVGWLSYIKGAYPPVGLNVMWAIIAIVSLFKLAKKNT